MAFTIALGLWGYRQGLIVGAMTLVGFAAGAFAGSRLAPLVLSQGSESPYAPLCAALGALLLNTINQALVAAKISSFWNEAIAGGLLLAAIAFDRWLSLRVARRLRSAKGAHRDV